MRRALLRGTDPITALSGNSSCLGDTEGRPQTRWPRSVGDMDRGRAIAMRAVP